MDSLGITGAGGYIGQLLVDAFKGKYDLTLYDKNNFAEEENSKKILDLSEKQAIKGIFRGVKTLIHLAADPSPDSSIKSTRRNNFEAARNVFEEAVENSVEKIVFASSNHVQNGYVAVNGPLDLDVEFYKKGRLIHLDDPFYPDCYYGASKIYGENIGRIITELTQTQFIALRIGWVIPEKVIKAKLGTNSKNHMRAMFLSRRDCIQAFEKAIESKEKCLSAYAISRNERRIFDLEETELLLNFHPQDNIEDILK